MRKSLKRVLDRLRTATNGRFRKPASVRGGLREPQRIQALCAWGALARSPPTTVRSSHLSSGICSW
jgi:hypothetical protein